MAVKRLCLFAGYNSNNIISDYVLYYLKELSKYADVYYCADQALSDEQKVRLEKIVKKAYGIEHKKYDFGSWAELIKRIGWKSIRTYNELLLVNDSCLGGVFSLKYMFEEMDAKSLEAWSAAGNHFMMSFFVCIKRKVFLTKEFKTFFNNIKEENNKSIIIKKYEKGLDELLQKYQTDVFLSQNKLKYFYLTNKETIDKKIKDIIPFYIRFLFHINYKKINLYNENAILPILIKFPFVKKNLFKNKFSLFSIYAKDYIIQNSDYPLNIIENMIKNEQIKNQGIISIIMYKIFFILCSFFYEEKYKKNIHIIRICKIPVYWRKIDYSI